MDLPNSFRQILIKSGKKREENRKLNNWIIFLFFKQCCQLDDLDVTIYHCLPIQSKFLFSNEKDFLLVVPCGIYENV